MTNGHKEAYKNKSDARATDAVGNRSERRGGHRCSGQDRRRENPMPFNTRTEIPKIEIILQASFYASGKLSPENLDKYVDNFPNTK